MRSLFSQCGYCRVKAYFLCSESMGLLTRAPFLQGQSFCLTQVPMPTSHIRVALYSNTKEPGLHWKGHFTWGSKCWPVPPWV